MNSAMKITLILISVVLFGMAASFIWFVATWDKEAEEPVTQLIRRIGYPT